MNGTPPGPRMPLPSEVSSFVGRRHELAQAREALGRARLVTLSGPGGVGKTRLALRAAADLAAGYRDGVRLVELAPVQDAGLVADTVVASLGLRGAPTAPPVEALVAHLRDRRMLLVLDNCEHLRDAVAALVRRLLDACPQVSIVATSRHALVLPEERLLTVLPFRVPPPRWEARSPEALRVFDSVRLFEERARSVWPFFKVTEENQTDVAELVRRLDGVPLAIELAAVRVRSLSVSQVLDRLDDRFSLLNRGDRAALPRQQSLRALMDWSHDLLTREEQRLWERASVFAGSFDATDLAAVACDETLPSQLLAGMVDELVTKSILIREQTHLGPRLRQLESIKAYGLRKLADAGDLERYRARHLKNVRGKAVTAGHELFGPSGVDWFRRLSAEHDDLRAALDRCAVDGGPADEGAEIMAALQHYWVMTGRFAEGRHWAGRLLPRAAATGIGRAALLIVAGRLAVLQGGVEEGRALLKEGVAHAAALDNPTWRAHGLHGLALAELFWDDPAAARELLEEALALHRTGEDPMGVPLALIQLATLHATLGHTHLAMTYAQESINLSEQAGEQYCGAMARWTQALAVWRDGHPESARSHAREVLQLKEPFGDRLGMAMCLEVVAWCAAAEERYDEAARLLGAVRSALDSVGGGLFRTLQAGHRDCVAGTREALGEPAYGELESQGAALPFEEAVALALGRPAQPALGDPSPALGAGHHAPQLTRRESEVARLVAEGLTDREIAERLMMARRTAEGHVQRALHKLGFTSRRQLAGWVHQQLGS